MTYDRPDNSQRIQECENRIMQCEQQIRTLEREMEEIKWQMNKLMDVRAEEARDRDEFIRSMDDERAQLVRIQRVGNIKMADGYTENMRRFLNGSVSQNAMGAYDELIRAYDRALDEMKEEIRMKNTRIYALEDEINSLQRELYTL